MNNQYLVERHKDWYKEQYPSDYNNYCNHLADVAFTKDFERSESAWLSALEVNKDRYLEINTRNMDGIQAVIAVKGGKAVQYYDDTDEKWVDFDLGTGFKVGVLLGEKNQHGQVVKFRLKPEYISINKVQLVAPLQEQPILGTNYWFYNPKKPNGIATGCWDGSVDDHAIFNNIGVFLEEQDVANYRDVMRQTIRGVMGEWNPK